MALNDPVEEPPAQPKFNLPAGPGRRAGLPRGHAGDKASGKTKDLIKEAILFKGTALVDIIQPCVSFNKTNTYQWYRERVFKLEMFLTDRYQALKTADLRGEKIPIGVIYRKEEA
jgi:2-oxoglutarate ferredoxin oxidoreductase subunit beta